MNQSLAFQKFMAAVDLDQDEKTEASVTELTSTDEPALLSLLNVGHADQRWWAARALAFCGTQAAVPGLVAALDDKEHVTRCIETNARERERLSEGLRRMGYRAVKSESNFVFMEVGPGAKELIEELLHLGVIVRPLGWMGFPEAIRISVGTAEENDKCLEALEKVTGEKTSKDEIAAR